MRGTAEIEKEGARCSSLFSLLNSFASSSFDRRGKKKKAKESTFDCLFRLPRAAVSGHFLRSRVPAVPISRSRGSSAAREWRFARADRARLGPERERTWIAGGCARSKLFLFLRERGRPGLSKPPLLFPPSLSLALSLSLSLSPPTLSKRTKQARRSAVVRISALAQRAEYIWFDGLEGAPEKVPFLFPFLFFSFFLFPLSPFSLLLKRYKKKKTQKSSLQGTVFNEMRSKTKVIQKPVTSGNPKDFPDWSFDGSSTGQAEGNNSDCILNPVAVYPDPVRGGQDVLVMCEVLNPDSTPHHTNTRAQLAALIDAAVRVFLAFF